MTSLGQKVLVASISVLLLLVGCGALVARELNGWDDAWAYVMRDYRRALLEGEFHEAVTRVTGEMASFVLTGRGEYRTEAVEALERANKAASMLRQIAAEQPVQPGDRVHVQVLARQERLLGSTKEKVAQLVRAGDPDSASAADNLRQIYAKEAEADALWLDAIGLHVTERQENEEILRGHSRRAKALLLVSVVAFAAWIGLLLAYVRQRIVKPLKALATVTSWVAVGDLARSIGVTHKDEIGQLQRSFNQMVADLAQQRGEIAAQVERVSRARDAAEAANRAKSDFLANISHELRTPMNGVMVALDLMHETAPNDELRNLADMARSSARGLLEMLNDLLDHSRIEAGKLELRSVALDPHQLVTQMVALHGRRAAAKGLLMTCNVAADVPAQLWGDPVRLGQVLLNLLDNAIKFTVRGCIDVSVAVDAPTPEPPHASTSPASVRLRFRVTDTGIGVREEAAQKIFQPFYQVDASTTRAYTGIGLGLGIARELARMMGGELDFESEVGKGSSFWFTARLLHAAPHPATAPPQPLASRQLGVGARVLLAEDNRDNREVMARLLECRGLRVATAANGRRALELATTEKFDVILMDCQMPVMDGFEATRAIRALGDERARVPIMAVTAYGLTGEMQRYLDAGFDGLVSKPYTVEEIEAVLCRWLVLQRRDDAQPPCSEPDKVCPA